MGEDIDEVIVRVRADTGAFARDVATMRGELEGPLANGVARAGRVIEGALARAISSGKFGFDDLKRVALRALGEIAAASLRSLLAPAGQGGGDGLGAIVTSLASSLLGAPGRATGGPVSGGRAYWVGERGPELFVPSGDGRIAAPMRGARDVKVAIAIQTPAAGDPQVLQKSSRQIARAVRSALRGGE
jgi:hypothetical protein